MLEIITLGSIIAFANICYLINKDCIKYCEDEIKEISKLIKEAFEKTIEYKETKEDERNRLRLTAIISHIEALQYTRLIKFALINSYYKGLFEFSSQYPINLLYPSQAKIYLYLFFIDKCLFYILDYT
ncbi:hypothetical protein NKC56_001417 [Campylobacter coli]|nr:hypothetical protein [Campylobacter coli]EJJ8775644.1 hypothetical protein [Campylobacter coli]EKP0439457.1 hypothetical protein [Campylobacter coli]ELK4351247.1 hypothetical protein [Campylobacter coli]